jgi:hypothetical protein
MEAFSMKQPFIDRINDLIENGFIQIKNTKTGEIKKVYLNGILEGFSVDETIEHNTISGILGIHVNSLSQPELKITANEGYIKNSNVKKA